MHETFCSTSEKDKKFMFSIKILLFKNFHRTCRVQFCRHTREKIKKAEMIFAHGPKMITKRRDLKTTFVSFNLFLETYNAVLTRLPKLFDIEPKSFRSLSELKKIYFQKNSSSSICPWRHVGYSVDNPVKKLQGSRNCFAYGPKVKKKHFRKKIFPRILSWTRIKRFWHPQRNSFDRMPKKFALNVLKWWKRLWSQRNTYVLQKVPKDR